tara:strand:- start:22666 stop:23127 length:462 start_codon:yes stop_codon:yes gene_type:complete
MKSKFTFLTFFLLGSLLFTESCKKDTTETPATNTKGISVSIDGTNWKTTTVTTTNSGTHFIISGIKANESVIISLVDLAVGTYPIDVSTNTAIFTNGNDFMTDIYSAISGEVEITSVNSTGTEFDGKFNFITINASKETKTFTSGTLTQITIP